MATCLNPLVIGALNNTFAANADAGDLPRQVAGRQRAYGTTKGPICSGAKRSHGGHIARDINPSCLGGEIPVRYVVPLVDKFLYPEPKQASGPSVAGNRAENIVDSPVTEVAHKVFGLRGCHPK